LQYYFEYLIQGNINALQQLITLKEEKSLIFELTPYAKKHDWTSDDLPSLSYKCLQLSDLSLFLKYKKNLQIISLILSFIQICFWVYASVYFLTLTNSKILFATLPSLWHNTTSVIKHPWNISKTWFHTSRSLLMPPREWSFVYEHHQNNIKLLTKGQFSPGHPLVGELLPDGTYRIDGYLTHGSSPNTKYNLFNLIPFTINPKSSKQGPQTFVAFDKPVFINPSFVKKPIQGSTAILENPPVKTALEAFLQSLPKK